MAQFCHQKIPLATSGLQCGRYHGPGECRLKSLGKRDDSGACVDAGVAMAGHNELVPGPVQKVTRVRIDGLWLSGTRPDQPERADVPPVAGVRA